MAKATDWGTEDRAADSWGADDTPAAKRELPAGVTPSTAEGGRGKVNPRPAVAKRSDFLDDDGGIAYGNPQGTSPAEMYDLTPSGAQVESRRSKYKGRVTDADVPPISLSSAVRDVASGALQIVPTAAKGVGEVARLVTGDTLGKGLSDYAQRSIDAAQQVVGSDRAAAQRKRFQQDMADPNLDAADVISGNPGALADQVLPTVGSMALPVGVAATAGRLAQAGKAAQLAKVIDPATVAARVATAQNAAVVGTTVAQNAGSTYGEVRDAGGDQGQAYLAAAITAPASYLAGRLTGGGSEGQLVKAITGRAGASNIVKGMVKEGAQEMGEEAGQYVGETVGKGEEFDANAASKKLAVAGTLGAVVGGGTDVVSGRIQKLREAGDKGAADMLERQVNLEAIPHELTAMGEAAAHPNFQAAYQELRTQGIKPAEAAARAGMGTGFGELAAATGLSEKATAAIRDRAAKLPLDQVPAFVEKAVTAMAARGLGKQLPPDAVRTTLEAVRDDAMKAAMDKVYADTPAATVDAIKALEQATAADAPAAAPAAAPAFEIGNDIDVTHETDAVHQAATSPLNDRAEPTQAQKEAGNYKLGHVKISGLDISVENPQGSVRRGTDADGKAWETPMKHHYGYFKGTEGADGDKLDVFIKPGTAADHRGPVFVVDQVDPKTGKLDEHKVIMGAKDQAEAEAIYRANYAADWQGLGAITGLPLPAFKAWAKSGTLKEPLGELKATAAPIEPGPSAIESVAPAPAAAPVEEVEEAPPSGEASPAQLAARAKAAARLRNPSTSPKGEPIPAHAFIAAEGGMTREAMADMGFDRNARVGNRTLFAGKGKGLTLEQATLKLIQDGYLPEGATHTDTANLITKSMKSPQYNPDGWARIAQAEAATRFEDHLAAQNESEDPLGPISDYSPAQLEASGYTAADEATQAEVRALLALAEAQGIDTETIREDASRLTSDQPEQAYYEAAKSALEAALQQGRGDRVAPDGEQGGATATSEGPEPGPTQSVAPAPTPAQTPADAGVSASGFKLDMRPTGTLAIKGNQDEILAKLTAGGVTKTMVMQGGIMVGKTQAAKARDVMEDKPTPAPAAKPLLMGVAPGSAEPVTVKDGVVFVGKYEAIDFESGEPITVPAGATDAQVKQALKDGGVLGKRQKFFGGQSDEAPAKADEPATAPAPAAPKEDLLTAPTKEEVLSKQERADAGEKAEAQRKKDEQAKAKADAERDEFTLTGSDRAADIAAAAGQSGLFETAEPVKIEDLGEKIGGARKDTAQPTGSRGTSAQDEDADPAWRRRFTAVENVAQADDPHWVLFDTRTGKALRGDGWKPMRFATQKAAEEAIPLMAVALKHRVRMASSPEGATYSIWREVSDRKSVKVVDKDFTSHEEAMRYMAEHAVEIIEAKTRFGEEVLAKPEKVTREGPARRSGPVKPEQFMDTFGFRGVEFGNWNNQAERQEVMNHAFDGLLDLAEVLNVPPKALSLNGEIGLGFGSRGQGLTGARAHYERSYGVMNLTKMQGAGALAHEWFHAMDHYLGRQDGKASSKKVTNARGDTVFDAKGREADYASHGFQWTNSGVRPEVREAFRDVMQTMFTKAEQFVEDTAQAEKFVGATRDALKKALDDMRGGLSKQLDPSYYKRNNKPATAEQLSEWDRLTDKLVAGEDLRTEYRNVADGKTPARSRSAMTGRMTNDTLDALGGIYKAVRGRSGMNAERSGALDYIRGHMTRYADRLKMLGDAKAETAKTKKVPTSFAMDAKRIDQGSVTDYWTTEHEMGARAFSAYVEDKLQGQARASDFLSYGSNNDMPGYRMLGIRPFPAGKEREAINAGFDKLFSTLQVRQEGGKAALFSRGGDREAARWGPVKTDFGPEYSARGVTLLPLQELDTTTDLAENSLPWGHSAHVVAGNKVYSYQVVRDGEFVGIAALEVGPDGQIAAIHDIAMDNKGKGAGRLVVESILASAKGEVRIIDIVDGAEGFWDKMGAGTRDVYQNATADYDSFKAAQPRREGREQGRLSRTDAEAGGGRAAAPGAAAQGNQQGLSAADGQRVVAALKAGGLRKLQLVETIEQLPASGREKMQSEGVTGVRGMYDPETDMTYLVRSNIGSTFEALFVGSHEAFHRGLRKTVGPEVEPILTLIHDSNEKVREDVKRFRAKHPKLGQIEAIEEVLADMAGRGEAGDLKGWDKLLAFLRDVIGKMAKAMNIKVELSDADITNLVAGVRRAGMQDEVHLNVGAAPVGNGASFGTLSHGTARAFDSFAVGARSGAGYHHQGRGIYLTSDAGGFARFFARAAAGRDMTLMGEGEDGVILSAKLKPEAKILDMRKGPVDADVVRLFKDSADDRAQGEKLKARVTALGFDGLAFTEPNVPDGWDVDEKATTVVVYNPAMAEVVGQGQTGTAAFKKWFGDSVVTDTGKAGGKPKVIYHGTTADLAFFDRLLLGASTKAGSAKQAFFFAASPKVASGYALLSETRPALRLVVLEKAWASDVLSPDVKDGLEAEIRRLRTDETAIREAMAESEWVTHPEGWGGMSGANVLPVYLQLKNPFVIDYKGEEYRERRFSDVIEEAKEAGHDGVIFRNAEDSAHKKFAEVSDIYAVFEPTQIKSATGNNGGFDGGNADIRFSRTGDLFDPEGWSAPAPTPTDRVIYELQDSRVDLKRVQQAITAAGREITEQFDPRLAETLYPGRVARRSEKFLADEVKPLTDAMAKNGATLDELGDYLIARHAPERNAQVAKVNAELPDGGAGRNSKGELMTNDAAAAYLAGLPLARREVMAMLAKKVDAITTGTRKLLVAEGLEKADVVAAWEGAYKNYVPLFKEETEHAHPQGMGFTVKGPASKRSTGSTREVEHVLAHVFAQRDAAITRAEKNRVGLALYGLALSHPNRDFWTTIKPGMTNEAIGKELEAMGVDPTVATAGMEGVPTVRTVDKLTNKVVDRPNPIYKNLPGAITLKVDGEDRVLMLNTKDPRAARMAEALKNLDGLTQLDIAGSIVGKTTRWMAAINTQYNPAFGLVNLVRDTLGGSINLGNTALRGKTLTVLANVPGAGQGIARELSGGGQDSEWSKLWKQFQDDGGRTGYREMFAVAADRAKAIEKELAAAEKAGKLTPGKVGHAVLDLLDGFNTTLENAVRLSAYKTALDQGLSRQQAARLARELTVDFNRKGRAGRELGPLYAFFNASVQGGARTIELLKGPTGPKVIAGGLALGAIQALLLTMMGYDDDEIPEFVKTRSLIIPMPGKDKTFISIPYPLGLHVIPNTGRIITELSLNGAKNVGKRAVNAVGEIAAAFNPLGGGNIFTPDGALKTLAPTVVDPLIELGFNRNFAGGKIEREAPRGEADGRPGYQRAKEATLRSTTGQAYLGISKAINAMMGGTPYAAGSVAGIDLPSPTPERIRYIAQTAGGGVLRELEKTVDSSVRALYGEKVKKSGIPVAGRFYGEVDEDQVEQARYYDRAKQLDKLQSTLAAAKKAGDGDAMLRIVAEHPELAMAQAQDRVQRDLAKLNKLAVQVVGDPDASKAIDEARVTTMKNLNDAIRDMEAATSKPTMGQRLRGAVARESVAAAP